MTKARFILAEVGAAAEAREAMEEAGLSIVRGWELPDEPWDLTRRRIACAGRIATRTDLEDALVAAARGASLVVEGPVPAELAAPLGEDLRRLGTVEHCCSTGLDTQQHRILTLLGEGLSVGEAAARLFISRRTADRRLAAARAALGVAKNNEAVVAVARHAHRERPENRHHG
jgi:DNA-binding CsgD family transcriptional regulator